MTKKKTDELDFLQELSRLRDRIGLLEAQPAPKRVFSEDDTTFLIWVLGFTAGANLERDGERGERVFGRCRDLYLKMSPASAGLGGNAS